MLKRAYQTEKPEAGCDEAGRGCLAGPVFAAAVILGDSFHHPLLNDSKKISKKNRDELRDYIEKKALSFAVAKVDAEEIDKINILNASIKAMHLAIEKLHLRPEFLIIDGNRFKPYQDIKHKTIVQGDALYQSIAAASILAKTYRDEYMDNLHTEYPQYHWLKNKGYATLDHRKAIKEFGLCQWHRKSFRLKELGLTLF